MKALLLLTVLSLAACKKDPPPTPPGNTGGDGVADPYACTADDDCVAVELECCDACNGGEAKGVHEDHVDAVVADSRVDGECEQTACTEMACPEWVPTCEAGKCAIARGTFE